MSEKKRAFQAPFVEVKQVKTRRVVQLVFELPIGAATNNALEMLGGIPDPATEVWCAIAIMDLKAESEVVSEPTKSLESKPSPPMPPARATPSKQPENKACQRLGILCGEAPFWKFLEERRISQSVIIKSEDSAAFAIREYFGVKSRTEIWEDNPKYVALMAEYRAWPTVLRVVPG